MFYSMIMYLTCPLLLYLKYAFGSLGLHFYRCIKNLLQPLTTAQHRHFGGWVGGMMGGGGRGPVDPISTHC